jgi:hypothetical protein
MDMAIEDTRMVAHRTTDILKTVQETASNSSDSTKSKGSNWICIVQKVVVASQYTHPIFFILYQIAYLDYQVLYFVRGRLFQGGF